MTPSEWESSEVLDLATYDSVGVVDGIEAQNGANYRKAGRPRGDKL